MSLESKIRSLKAHPLIQVLADNGGNPRTLVLIEPLWGVPYNLIAPFATLYMYTQGITDVQIGLIFSDGGWPVWCGLFRTISGCFWPLQS